MAVISVISVDATEGHRSFDGVGVLYCSAFVDDTGCIETVVSC